MAGGKGLSFLNKKTWHTGGFRNREEVWKREQEAIAEQARVEEIKKQIKEERQLQELRELEHKAKSGGSGGVRGERVEFLYAGPLAGRIEEQKKREKEHLLGKPVERLEDFRGGSNVDADKGNRGHIREEQPLVLQARDKSASTAVALIDNANERWARMHSDPLLAMKQQEMAALKRVRENPMTMAKLREEVEARKEKKRARKEEKRAKKKEKKERKKDSENERDGFEHVKEAKDERGEKNDSDVNVERKCEVGATRDGATAQGAGVQYGLTRTSNARSVANDASSITPYRSTLQHRGIRNHRPQSCVREDSRNSHSHNRYKNGNAQNYRNNGTGKLSEEEKRKRREEMQREAELHENGRWNRIASARAQEQDEEIRGGKEAIERHHSERATFISNAERQIYGSSNNASLEDRLGRRKFYSDVRS